VETARVRTPPRVLKGEIPSLRIPATTAIPASYGGARVMAFIPASAVRPGPASAGDDVLFDYVAEIEAAATELEEWSSSPDGVEAESDELQLVLVFLRALREEIDETQAKVVAARPGEVPQSFLERLADARDRLDELADSVAWGADAKAAAELRALSRSPLL
jgi:hypothetical protein